jgi:hypothetical protein
VSDVNANININIDSSSALAGLRNLETKINQFQRTIASSNAAAAANQSALNKALLDGINNTGLFSAKQVNAVDSMARFSNALDKNKLSLAEYSRFASSQLPGMSRVFRREFDTMEQIATSRVKTMNTQYLALGKTVDGVTKAIAATPTGLADGIATSTAIASQKQMIFNKLIDFFFCRFSITILFCIHPISPFGVSNRKFSIKEVFHFFYSIKNINNFFPFVSNYKYVSAFMSH